MAQLDTDVREKRKKGLLNAPVKTSGLFGPVVDSITHKFELQQKESVVLHNLMPQRARSLSSQLIVCEMLPGLSASGSTPVRDLSRVLTDTVVLAEPTQPLNRCPGDSDTLPEVIKTNAPPMWLGCSPQGSNSQRALGRTKSRHINVLKLETVW